MSEAMNTIKSYSCRMYTALEGNMMDRESTITRSKPRDEHSSDIVANSAPTDEFSLQKGQRQLIKSEDTILNEAHINNIYSRFLQVELIMSAEYVINDFSTHPAIHSPHPFRFNLAKTGEQSRVV
jgi:hypothetical protein